MCVGEKRKVSRHPNTVCFLFSSFLFFWLKAAMLGEIISIKIGLQVVVPPELGYGETGAPPDIPPNAVLAFELELVKIDQRNEL